MKVTYLGHAGLKVETIECTLLVDPWFSPEGAFLASWFQYPDNQHLIEPTLLQPSAIAISHEHLDHVDPWFLSQVAPNTPIIIPSYPSPILKQKIVATGLKNIIEVTQWQELQVSKGT
ncbi:MAG: MBL fold metallo-hydrolase, partial [Calothrix sp. SM1_7_51]|nr:MBL fold metallo-hydrolase [Calothrix sp. SM1_7_51]